MLNLVLLGVMIGRALSEFEFLLKPSAPPPPSRLGPKTRDRRLR
jgi:hypothetical protein